MPTAVASAIAPQISQPHVQQDLSPKSSYPALAPSKNMSSPNAERKSPGSSNSNPAAAGEASTTPQRVSPDGKRSSPNSARSGQPPKIVVKKEPPSSPEASATSRHRPRKLDLTSSTPSNASGGVGSKPSGSQTARETTTLVMQDVGLACLSPGFQTQDPTMQQQLQRSHMVRDQQRHIIESRLQKSAKATDGESARSDHHLGGPGLKTPLTSKKRPNPGLSIVPPSAEQFANERVIRSAPLHHTFTGQHQPHPLTRQVLNAQSNHHDSSHIHNVPSQSANRLPPITDVFANDGIGLNRDGPISSGRPAAFHTNPPPTGSHRPAFPSPGLQAPTSAAATAAQQQPPHHRAREYRSAEEAVAEMTSGREDLLPKLVHYGGHQPPTPPSPSAQHGLTPNKHAHHPHAEASRSSSGRRRPRTEYEHDAGSPPLGSGPSPRRGPFGEGRDSPETNRRKKEEFLSLCARAWELFHS